MNITAKQGALLEEKADLLILGIFAGTQMLTGEAKVADKALGGLLTTLMAEEDFGGREGDQLVLHTHGKLGARRIIMVGMGEKKSFGAEAIRRASGLAVRYAKKIGATELVAPLLGNSMTAISITVVAQAISEGALLTDYTYLVFKPNEAKRLKKRGVVTVTLIVDDLTALRAAERGIALGDVMVRGTVYARDLVNEPASRMTPTHLKEHAEKIAAHGEGIRVKILDRAECERMGMGAYLAVARGSEDPPYFIHLTYRPPATASHNLKKIALVGKGITFDSGGLFLKPYGGPAGMETMKCDMAGAAAVLSVFSVLPDMAPDLEIHGIIAATDNMPSAKAVKPGDIVTAMNGKTVEIMHTDAEGRLALADSFSYVEKKIKPDVLIDLATLTLGPLGPDYALILGTDQKLIDRIMTAARGAGESLWQLPLPNEYASSVVGDHADIRNVSRIRGAGAITAALFLRHFVITRAWAHLDIGSPAFVERETLPYLPKGGTGYGVRTLLNYLLSY